MQKFALWCKYRYLTQRDYDFDEATIDAIDAISIWHSQLQKDPDPLSVENFIDGGDKREWFESIHDYLG